MENLIVEQSFPINIGNDTNKRNKKKPEKHNIYIIPVFDNSYYTRTLANGNAKYGSSLTLHRVHNQWIPWRGSSLPALVSKSKAS